MKIKTIKKARSAVTGRFIKASFAKRHPKTTYADTTKIRFNQKKKGK